jgi:hypothetical protein
MQITEDPLQIRQTSSWQQEATNIITTERGNNAHGDIAMATVGH